MRIRSCTSQETTKTYTPYLEDFYTPFKMEDPNITMEEYIRLQAKKARRRGQTFNWETATYVPVDDLKPEPVNDHIEINTELCLENIDIKPMDNVVCISNDTTPVESDEYLETNQDKKKNWSPNMDMAYCFDLVSSQLLIDSVRHDIDIRTGIG
ncbi:hypothetical protein Tco_0691434 [Tanacetum coccineum]